MTPRKPKPPIGNPPPRLRQRLRADGSWRIWWEPRAEQRKLGLAAVELDAGRITWSLTEARRLNAAAEKAAETGAIVKPGRATGRRITDLIASYRQSVHFRHSVSDATRRSYGSLMLMIEDKWGTQRVIAFDKATMYQWYQTLYNDKDPRTAQALIAMMSILFGHAETLGWRPDNSNPCQKLGIKAPEPRNRVVTWPEFEALITAAESMGRQGVILAAMLSRFQGQRVTDVLKARRDEFALEQIPDPMGGTARPVWVWRFTRSKNTRPAVLAVHDEVIPHLRRALADAGTATNPNTPGTRLVLDESTGRDYDPAKPFLFNKRWASVRAEAAKIVPSVIDVQFRDLRASFSAQLHDSGVADSDTTDALGNTANKNPALRRAYLPASFASASRAITAVERPKPMTRKKG